MAKLQCKVCGGKLSIDADGKSSECASCGMTYSQEVMQQMLGTREDPVHVTGEVKVSGISDADKLANNSKQFLDFGEFEKAREHCLRMSNEYPEDYRGWWGLVLADTRNLSWNPITPEVKDYYAKALKTADQKNAQVIRQQYEEAAKKFQIKLERWRTGGIVGAKSCEAILYMSVGGDYLGRVNNYFLTNQGRFIRAFTDNRKVVHTNIIYQEKETEKMTFNEYGACRKVCEEGVLLYISDDYKKIILPQHEDVDDEHYHIVNREFHTDFKNHRLSYKMSDDTKNTFGCAGAIVGALLVGGFCYSLIGDVMAFIIFGMFGAGGGVWLANVIMGEKM